VEAVSIIESDSTTNGRRKMMAGPKRQPEREGKGEAACSFDLLVRPNARHADKRSWARLLRAEGEIRKEGAGPRREKRKPSGQKEDFYFLFLF
jgi:hypothetical protein